MITTYEFGEKFFEFLANPFQNIVNTTVKAMTLKSVPPFYWLSIPKYKTQEVLTYTMPIRMYTVVHKL